jgi:hypothetical protein
LWLGGERPRWFWSLRWEIAFPLDSLSIGDVWRHVERYMRLKSIAAAGILSARCPYLVMKPAFDDGYSAVA